MSLHVSTHRAVLERREIDEPAARAAAPSRGTTSPCTRRRATPPSGKMSSRTCVNRCVARDGERVLACRPASGERGRSSIHVGGRRARARSSGVVDRRAPRCAHDSGKLPRKNAVSTTTPRITPGRPSRTTHQSWTSLSRPGATPSAGDSAASPSRPSTCRDRCTRARVHSAACARRRFSFSAKNSSLHGDRRAADGFAREIGQVVDERSVIAALLRSRREHAAVARRRACRAGTSRARTPRSVSPAYGVTLWRWCTPLGVTVVRLVVGEHDEVGVARRPRSRPSCREPGEPRRRRAHPARDVARASGRARAPRSTRPAARAAGRRCRPTRPRSRRAPSAFSAGVHGE